MSNYSNRDAKRILGHRLMIESFAAHEERAFRERFPPVLAERKYCISTLGGLTMCGRTAYRTLPYVKFGNTQDRHVCSKCASEARAIAKDVKAGVFSYDG